MRRLAAFLVLAATLLPVASAAFPQSAPNDPSYAPAEASAPQTCGQVSVNDEQHYLYSFMPRCARNARDPENASGMSVDAAWAAYTVGEPQVVIAYVEGGINWHDGGARDLANQVWLNVGELPLPEGCAAYDCSADGVVNVQDYANDARVSDANANGFLDAEDLIVAFSDGVDQDANGFVDDVSGWDFYDHQNDPATVDSTYDHANGQMRQAAAEANNAFMGAGVCPGCRILPIKAGAEALDRSDDLAQAWLYAGRMGAKVIVSVTADLGYSTYMAQAVEHLWREGVVMVEASNDFDSLDHQGGMWWPHVLPGNGLVTNTQGDPDARSANLATTTFRARSDETSWGAHNVFSVATQGGSTSTSTPTVGGVLGLVLSEGVKAHREGKLARPLSGPEAIQVVAATASDVADPSLAWAGKPGWDLQYGYGRPNVLAAMQAVEAGAIPPAPSLDAPRWFELYDPTMENAVPVDGHVAACRAPPCAWSLEWGLGAEPTSFAPLASGMTDAFHASLPLDAIPESFWSAPYAMSGSKSLETNEKYTVTLVLHATDAQGRVGEDRRAIAVHHDPTALPGFPLRLGPGGESQPALVDLQGTGRLAIVFADTDGRVHALDPATRHELPGWPATTDATVPEVATEDVEPGHEPVIAPVAVGDVDGDGQPDVVVASTAGKVYAFDAHGARLAGWPQDVALHAVTPPIPRPALDYTRLPHRGTSASPMLADLDRDGRLDVVQAAWDGHVYAFRGDGSSLPGWPVRVELPASHKLFPGYSLVRDAKVDVTPALADLDGDGAWEIVVQSQLTEVLGAGIQPFGFTNVFAYHADGSLVAGWPARLPGVVEYYGSAQEFITEGSSAPAVADVDHDGKDEVVASHVFGFPVLLNGDGTPRAVYGPTPNALSEILAGTPPADVATGDLPADAPVTFTTSGAFGKLGGTLSYAQAGSGGASTATALLLTGSGFAIKNHERAFDAATGAARPGFPAKIQGLNFLGAPVLADVDGDGLAEVLDGGDSSTLHAFTAAGTMAAGFPKFTTGWTLWSPAVGDLFGDGTVDVVATTREGYLMAWSTPGKPTHEWWTYHHDEQRTGRYAEPLLPPVATKASPAPWQLAAAAPALVLVAAWVRRRA